MVATRRISAANKDARDFPCLNCQRVYVCKRVCPCYIVGEAPICENCSLLMAVDV